MSAYNVYVDEHKKITLLEIGVQADPFNIFECIRRIKEQSLSNKRWTTIFTQSDKKHSFETMFNEFNFFAPEHFSKSTVYKKIVEYYKGTKSIEQWAKDNNIKIIKA